MESRFISPALVYFGNDLVDPGSWDKLRQEEEKEEEADYQSGVG